MSKNCCRDIVYHEWPEKLEAWLRVERKLNTAKNNGIAYPRVNVSNSVLDPEEREVLEKLLCYFVKEYEKKHGSLSYLADKLGLAVLMLGLKEIVERLT